MLIDTKTQTKNEIENENVKWQEIKLMNFFYCELFKLKYVDWKLVIICIVVDNFEEIVRK